VEKANRFCCIGFVGARIVMKKSQIALGVAAAFGAVTVANAVVVSVTLVGAQGETTSGTSDKIIAASTATWSYDTVTDIVTGVGLLKEQTQIVPLPGQLFTHNVVNFSAGGGGAASATSYSCIEGSFGGGVGASLCGNYNYGANFLNESSTSWGPGTASSRTMGGDDVPIGPMQNVNSNYDGMSGQSGTGSWDGTTLVMSNIVPLTTGSNLTFTVLVVDIDVNDYTGLTQGAAETAIVADGLSVGTVTTASSPTVPSGDVISQNPTACTACVAPGSAVDLVVSTGPANIDVNDYTGQTQGAAEAAIVADGLTVGNVTTASSGTVPSGTVISQNPTPCTACVAPGSAVDLVVSTGPANIDVNDYTGQTQGAAEAAIVADGLTVGNVTTASSGTVPSGTVISQSPTPCTACVAPGSAVDLVVSSGPANIDVNDYTGQTQAAAEAAIVADGLTVGNVTTASSGTVPSGTVISQNPTPCTACAAPGDSVDLVVSSGPASIDVGTYTGLTQAAASAAIVADGLTVGNVTTASSGTVPSGSVISQNPTPCTACAAPGDSVDLVVSSGIAPPADIDVNDYTGQTQGAAEAAIVADGLTVGNVTTASSGTVPSGSVISQSPTPCTACVAPGSAVDLVVSAGPASIDVGTYTGQTQGAAEAAIVADGLTVGNVTTANSPTVPSGTVISQNPTPCTACAAPGDAVDLVVSSGPAPVMIDVNDYTGLAQAAAEAAIVADDLTVGNVTTASSPTVPSGTVISQNPAPCTACADSGDPVDLLVSSGPAPVLIDVPDVVGVSQAAAESSIVSMGLTVGNVTTASSPTVPSGTVISQDPSACTECAAPGDPVDLVVSTGPGTSPTDPAEQIEALIDQVNELDLGNRGQTQRLIVELDKALKELNRNRDDGAVKALEVFISKVEAQDGKAIDSSDAEQLIAAAEDIIDEINNPSGPPTALANAFAGESSGGGGALGPLGILLLMGLRLIRGRRRR
jgi:beta-lactam-binding protein with PASTA domain